MKVVEKFISIFEDKRKEEPENWRCLSDSRVVT